MECRLHLGRDWLGHSETKLKPISSCKTNKQTKQQPTNKKPKAQTHKYPLPPPNLEDLTENEEPNSFSKTNKGDWIAQERPGEIERLAKKTLFRRASCAAL